MFLKKTPPLDFKPQAEIAIALPFIKDKILLLQRLPNHPQANLWCLPGGKLNDKEMPLHAAIRELKEETGIDALHETWTDLGKYFVSYPNGDFICHLFKVHINHDQIYIKIRKNEHQDFCLCSLHETVQFSLTPGLQEYFDFMMHDAMP